MDYVIGAPYPDPCSAGIAALYKLNTDLRNNGQRSRVVNMTGYEKLRGNELLILPDTIIGNPLKAKRVVRYLLMTAGFFGHDRNFPESELLYYHSRDFIINGRNENNILTVPASDDLRFPYKKDGRSGSCYIARKYRNAFGYRPPDLPKDCFEIDHTTDLKLLFARVETLITYDNTAINLEAALAGIKIDWRFNPAFEKPISIGDDFDWSNARESYIRLKERYYTQQLPDFIKRTQEHFNGTNASSGL